MNLNEFLVLLSLNLIISYVFYTFISIEHHFFAGSMYGATMAGMYCVYVVRFKR